METLKQCSCGRTFSSEQSSGKYCFVCKLEGLSFTWRGPTRSSRQDFHDNTIRSVLAEGDRNYEALNPGKSAKDDLIHVGNRWV